MTLWKKCDGTFAVASMLFCHSMIIDVDSMLSFSFFFVLFWLFIYFHFFTRLKSSLRLIIERNPSWIKDQQFALSRRGSLPL